LLVGYPVLFVLKKDNKFKLCIDYCQFNVITKKNCYSLLFIVEFKDRLIGARWFIVLNLLKVYSLFRIKKEYKWKIAFRIKFRYFEYLILSFGFINVLIIFQVMINYILREYIDRIFVVYLNDIFIFNKTLEKHKEYIHLILIALKQANLYINVYKSIFYN